MTKPKSPWSYKIKPKKSKLTKLTKKECSAVRYRIKEDKKTIQEQEKQFTEQKKFIKFLKKETVDDKRTLRKHCK